MWSSCILTSLGPPLKDWRLPLVSKTAYLCKIVAAQWSLFLFVSGSPARHIHFPPRSYYAYIDVWQPRFLLFFVLCQVSVKFANKPLKSMSGYNFEQFRQTLGKMCSFYSSCIFFKNRWPGHLLVKQQIVRRVRAQDHGDPDMDPFWGRVSWNSHIPRSRLLHCWPFFWSKSFVSYKVLHC